MLKHTAVAIIGAGISGLSLAYFLQKQGIDVLVLEQSSTPGGKIHSLCEDNFVIERGAQTILGISPLVRTLLEELDLNSKLLTAHPYGKKRYIVRDGTLREVPTDLGSFLRTNLLSLRAKVQLFREPFVKRSFTEETVTEFALRRFGNEWLHYIFDPLVVSHCAGSPDTVSIDALLPTFVHFERTYGSVAVGILFRNLIRRNDTKYRTPKHSFLQGLSTLPYKLAEKLGTRVLYNTKVNSLDRVVTEKENVFRIRTTSSTCRSFTATKVVFATEAPIAAKLLEKVSPRRAQILRTIYYPPLTVINFVFQTDSNRIPYNGFGFLVPFVENSPLLGCIWNSSLYPQHAPSTYAVCTAFVGGTRTPEPCFLNVEGLEEKVLYDVKKFMHISCTPVRRYNTWWEHSLPQFERGHKTKVEVLETCEQQNDGIYCIGNFMCGTSIAECINTAYRKAQEIVKQYRRVNT